MTPGYCTACRRPATSTEVGWFHNGQGCDGGEFVAACACGGFAGDCWVCRTAENDDDLRDSEANRALFAQGGHRWGRTEGGEWRMERDETREGA